MQHAKTALKLSVIAALLAHGAFAAAQPVALPPVPGAPAALAAPALPEIKAGAVSLAASAKAVTIGKQDDASGAAGSLKEMENLQREAFLGELRAKIRTANGAGKVDASATVAASAVPSQPSVSVPLTPATFAAPATSPTMFPIYRQSSAAPLELQGEPKAELVSVIVTSSRTRADVMDDGLVKTVKEGDKLGEWSITSITTNGVTVERTVTRLSMAQPPVFSATRNGASARKRVVAIAPVPYEKTMSVMLKPYRPPVAEAISGTIGGVAVPVIPPLPSSIRPQDSTSILPAAQIAAK